MHIQPSQPDLETIVNRVRRGSIDLQPDFQRDLVWNKAKKQGLIDTILRDWKFPPIFLVLPLSGDRLEVLDGQQRLNAIIEFFEGKFPVNGKIEPADEYIKDIDGCFYNDLPASYLRRVNEYAVQFFELRDYNEDEPYELFFRLNQGASLTPSERRNTLYGPVRSQVREVVDYMDSLGLNIDRIGFNNSRLSYHDVISRFLYILDGRGRTDKKIADADLVRFFRSNQPVSKEAMEYSFNALIRLSESISTKVRLNKSTLFTWLLYFSNESSCTSLLNDFEEIRSSFKADMLEYGPVYTLISIYQDKVSTSVNDAVPVQLRLLITYLVIFMHFKIEHSSLISENARKILDGFLIGEKNESILIQLMNEHKWNYE